MKKYLFLCVAALSIATAATTTTTFANDKNDVAADTMGAEYTVIPIPSEHQDPEISGYFDMNWAPGEKGELGLAIVNNTNEDKVFELKLNKGLTNSNGVLIYDDSSQNKAGEEPRLQDLFSIPKEVKVKAKSTEEIKTEYKLPDSDLKGTKIAGIYVSEKTKDADGQVSMKYSYAYPIVVRGNAKGQPEVKMDFGEFNIVEGDSSSITIVTPFSNKNANYLKGSTIDVSLKNSSGDEVYGIKKKDLIITPESKIEYSSYLEEPLKPGDYTVDLTITNGKNEWKDSQKVTVAEPEAPESDVEVRGGSEEAPDLRKPAIAVIGAFVVFLLGYVMISKKKKNENGTSDVSDSKDDSSNDNKDINNQ